MKTALKALVLAVALMTPAVADASLTVVPGLTVRNGCGKHIIFAVRYQDFRRNWVTQSFIGINAGETKTHVVGMGGPVLYYYAETSDGAKTRWRGDHNVRVDGKTYPMKQKALTLRSAQNQYFLGLTCQ